MLVKPLKPQKPKPYALLTPGLRTLTVQTGQGDQIEARGPRRCEQLLEKLAAEKVMCYTSGRLSDMRHATGATGWVADVWRGQPTRMRLDGVPLYISSIRSVLKDHEEPMVELAGAFQWLSDQGISPASLSSMAWKLWRITLDQPFQASFQAKVGREALYGGRQSAKPGNFTSYLQADIQRAYPHAMSGDPYATTLMQVANNTHLDPTLPGLAQAAVFVPAGLGTPPLPRRLARDLIRWEWGDVHGTWTWRELAMAIEAGCDVDVEKCWAPVDLIRPFDGWYDLQNEGRNLTHGADVIKQLSTLLWGLFGLTADDTAICRWEDEAGTRPLIVGQPIRHTPHDGLSFIAAETASRVRTRMYREALMDTDTPVHVDTDGVIIPVGARLPRDMGPEPGQWRVKRHYRFIDIRGPQVYRSVCEGECSQLPHCEIHGSKNFWHFSTAGVPPHLAPRLFDGMRHDLNVSVMGRDMVLEDGWRGQGTVEQNRAIALVVHDALVGPPLVVMP